MKPVYLIVLVACMLASAGCAFLIEPLDTGSHVWWDNIKEKY